MRNFVERFGIRGLRRFLCEEEIALCMKSSSTFEVFNAQDINITRIAGFWAAKEACSKALGVGIGRELGFLDIHLSKNDKNAPLLCLSDEKMKYFALNHISLSISHDGGFAIAVVFCA